MKSEPPERTPQQRHPSSTSQRGGFWASAAFLVLLVALPVFAFAQSTSAGAGIPQEIPSYAWQTALLVLLTIALNGLFVAADSAIELLKSGHVRAAGERAAPRIQDLIQNRSHYVAACTLGTQTMMGWQMALAFLPAPALASAFARSQGSPVMWWQIFVAGVLLTLPVAALNLVFGILIPKSLAAQHPIRAASLTYSSVKVMRVLFSPVILVISSTANLFAKRFGANASFMLPREAEEEIRSMVDDAQESGAIEEIEKDLLHSVFEFGDTVAREVMTPRVDLDSAPVDIDPPALLDLMQESGHSRIPLYEKTDDQIVGFVHVKDLIGALRTPGSQVNLRHLVRPALFVPENKVLHDVLREMRLSRTQMAIVQDEFGGTAGVVTVEDIVEELVGDIIDEYDDEEETIQLEGEGWVVEGRMNLYDLNEEIGSTFQSDEFDTIGGYLFGLYGRQPAAQAVIDHQGYQFRVVETDGKRILKLHIEKLEEPSLLDTVLEG